MGDTSDEFEERLQIHARKQAEVARQQAEVEREQQELRIEAEQQLARIEFEIAEVEKQLKPLYERRDKAAKTFLGLRNNKDSKRAHKGALKDACLAALRTNRGGMTSHGVKGWIAKNIEGLRTNSVPATLSRILKQGIVRKDAEGKYSLI